MSAMNRRNFLGLTVKAMVGLPMVTLLAELGTKDDWDAILDEWMIEDFRKNWSLAMAHRSAARKRPHVVMSSDWSDMRCNRPKLIFSDKSGRLV